MNEDFNGYVGKEKDGYEMINGNMDLKIEMKPA